MNSESSIQHQVSQNPTKLMIEDHVEENPDGEAGLCGSILVFLSWVLIILTMPFSLFVCFKVVQEYERAVIFRLGRLLSGGAKGPGIFFILPCVDNYAKVDLRSSVFDIRPQEVLTKDSVTVSVDAVVYYRVCNATISVANVENAHHSTRLLAQTTLRNTMGTRLLSEILSERENISQVMQTALDDATVAWGIKVERVEIKDVRLPIQLQRAMAAEAEASREARAKVIAAEGEQKASRALREASEVIGDSPAALQLRYLQQQHQPERYVGPSAYDPSRDLSPNLPVDNKSSMGDIEHLTSNISATNTASNNNNNPCSVSSCSFRHGPTTSNFEVSQPECLQYGGRRNPSPAPYNRFDPKVSFPSRPNSPSLISRFDNGKLNHSLSNKQTSPNYSFKPPTPTCYSLKKPSSPAPCAFSSSKLEDFKPPSFEFGKFNNNNNNNTSNNNNNNNNDGPHSEYQDFQPKVEQLPTPNTPPTPLSNSDESAECAGCGRKISDRFYLSAVDRKWHAACLQCCQCHAALDGEITCFTRHGNIYCKKDYYRMFVMKRCARCQAAISSSELVMRARDFVFHVHCFTCTVCNTALTKGDHFGLRDGAIFCRSHYDLNEPPETDPQPHFPQYPASFPSPEFPHSHTSPIPLPPPGPSPTENVLASKVPFFNGSSTAAPRQKGRPRKRKPKDLEAMTANLDLNDSYLDFGRGPNTPGSLNASGRSKRMRTSFKHHQLRTMKSYFSINHNPDAKDLKQLSQKTSLPKRVLQVWFQNARAKWRRMMVKQEGKSEKCSESGGLSDLETFPSHSGGNVGSNMSLGPHSPPFVLSNSCSSPASLDCS